jgi:hypothetical protein
MMLKSAYLLAAAALLGTGAAAIASRHGDADAQRDLDKALAGHVAGKTVECIDPHLAEGPQIVGQHVLLYRSGGTIWKNDLIGPCPSLRSDSTIISEIYGGQLCRNDRFRTREPGDVIPSAYCRLGNFTEYKSAKR